MIMPEDDIDDLFRKARENYPLKTDVGDWNRVVKELQNDDGEPAASASKTPGKFNRQLLWLLLLIPLGLLINLKLANDKASSHLNKIGGGKMNKTTVNSPTHTTQPNKEVTRSLPFKEKANRPQMEDQGPNNRVNNQPSFSPTRQITTSKSENRILGISSQHPAEQAVLDSAGRSGSRGSTPPTKQQPASLSQNTAVTPGIESNKEHPVAKGNSSNPMDTSLAKNKKENKPLSKISKGVYIGLLAGPDISTIKLQSVKKVGYSWGLLLGYRFTKRVSLETNLLWARKDYFTDGKYIDKKNFSIPSTVPVINLNGYCNMYEFDITGRYDFSPYKKQHFFARGGFASYFMKEQDYTYLATNPAGTPYSQSGEYGNTTNNLFSVLHISAGYEYKAGKVSVRIEPYLKIPTKGLGEGKLSFTSMSLYVGLSVPLQ
jgi:hypothetical protein